MTIEVTECGVTYIGNGATIDFDFDFVIPYQADGATPAIKVRVLHDTGFWDTLVLNTDFTVTGIGDPTGGTVTVTDPPTSTDTITIERNLDDVQDTAVANSSFYPHTLETVADTLLMVTQEVRRVANHSINFPTVEEAPDNIPPSARRRDTVIGFDANGTLFLYPISQVGLWGNTTQSINTNAQYVDYPATVVLLTATADMEVYLVPADNPVKDVTFILISNGGGLFSATIKDGPGGNTIGVVSAVGGQLVVTTDGSTAWPRP